MLVNITLYPVERFDTLTLFFQVSPGIVQGQMPNSKISTTGSNGFVRKMTLLVALGKLLHSVAQV